MNFAALAYPARMLIVVSVLLWAVSFHASARGTPMCISKFQLTTREAIIRQGAWSYLLKKGPSERAARGEIAQGYIPTTRIDGTRVDAFLKQHPNCCQIHPLAVQEGLVGQILVRAQRPSVTMVEVKARPQRPVDYMDHFEVDACWDNLATT